MEVPDANNEVVIKQEHAHWLQTYTPVVPLWALGSLECSNCEFRTKYKTVLRDHKEKKHIVGYSSSMNTNVPQIRQQNASSIPK